MVSKDVGFSSVVLVILYSQFSTLLKHIKLVTMPFARSLGFRHSRHHASTPKSNSIIKILNYFSVTSCGTMKILFWCRILSILILKPTYFRIVIITKMFLLFLPRLNFTLAHNLTENGQRLQVLLSLGKCRLMFDKNRLLLSFPNCNRLPNTWFFESILFFTIHVIKISSPRVNKSIINIGIRCSRIVFIMLVQERRWDLLSKLLCWSLLFTVMWFIHSFYLSA